MVKRIPEQLVAAAANCVVTGGVLLYPTDTVYGIGGDAGNDDVSIRIRRIKDSEPTKPLLALTDTWERVTHWIADIDSLTRTLMTIGREDSLTILFRATSEAPAGLLGSSDEVGIRYCRHPFVSDVIGRSGRVLSSTSANRTREPVPGTFRQVDERLLDEVDVFVDGGDSEAIASTIVRVSRGRVEIVREGGLSATMISRLTTLSR